MKYRGMAILFAAVGLVCSLSGPVAEAAVGPTRLQELAQVQTDLLLSHYHQGDIASPASCKAKYRVGDVFVLPSLSFSSGDASFSCRTTSHHVLVDLGGAIATEDNRGDTYTTADGEVLLYTRANLEKICDDALRYYPTPAPATVDGSAIAGTQVSTPAFTAMVNPNAGTYWQDSVDLGHPGRLAASYCGWKDVVYLGTGRHLMTVDLSDTAGAPTQFVYHIKVLPRHWRKHVHVHTAS